MESNRRGAGVRAAVVAAMLAATAVVGVPVASAHGTANCNGTLGQVGSAMEGSCTLPFNGLPIGVAGVYNANALGRPEAEIHVEVQAKLAFAPPRPIGVECVQTTTGVARCRLEHNPAGNPLEGPEPLPTEVLALHCNAHSHSPYSRNALPSGAFACWSGDAGRADLEAEGFFSGNGF